MQYWWDTLTRPFRSRRSLKKRLKQLEAEQRELSKFKVDENTDLVLEGVQTLLLAVALGAHLILVSLWIILGFQAKSLPANALFAFAVGVNLLAAGGYLVRVT